MINLGVETGDFDVFSLTGVARACRVMSCRSRG